MNQATTRREACAYYGHRWQTSHFDEAKWREILDALYDGKRATQIIAELDLDAECKSSLTVHAREHRGYIRFMQGVRLKDKRLQYGATLTDAWRELIERIFAIALDPSTKPGIAVRAAVVAQKDQADLQRLAQTAIEEFTREDDGRDGKAEDMDAMLRRVAADVFGIRPNEQQ